MPGHPDKNGPERRLRSGADRLRRAERAAHDQARARHFKKAGTENLRKLAEFRVENASEFKLGDVITVAKFSEGQMVDVIGTTKGRGFQGVMKRYNFDGQPQTHGHMMHRRPGSVGCRQTPGHVYKGRKMPGHMGQVRCTTQNHPIVKVLEDKNILLIKGSIPGAKGDIVIVRPAKKAKKA